MQNLIKLYPALHLIGIKDDFVSVIEEVNEHNVHKHCRWQVKILGQYPEAT